MNFSLNAEAMVAADAITSWEDACIGQQLPDQELDYYRKHYIAWKVLRDNVNIVYTLASRACRPELDAKFPDEARVSKLVAQVLDLYSMEAPHCEVFDGEMVRSDFRLEALMEARDQDEKFWNQPSEKLRTPHDVGFVAAHGSLIEESPIGLQSAPVGQSPCTGLAPLTVLLRLQIRPQFDGLVAPLTF